MLELTWKFTHTIGVISCTHWGSRYAIWPPNYETWEGNEILQNSAQRKLWKYWENLAEKFDEFRVQEIWHLGDLIEGKNPAEGGRGLMVGEIKGQKEAAVLGMRPVIKDRIYRQLSGSPYHEGEEKTDPPEVEVAKAFNGSVHGPILKIRFEDSRHVFKVMHGATAAMIYPGTPAEREIRLVKEAEAIGVYEDAEPITAFVEGHLHYAPMHNHKYGCHFIRVGTWKVWDGSRPARKSYGNYPKINAGIILIDDRDRLHYIMFDFKPTPSLIDKVTVVPLASGM